MPKKDKNILKHNHGEKFMNILFLFYADTKPLLEKIYTCYSNPEKLSKTKINQHTAPGYSLFMHCLFDATKTKPHHYRGKDCVKNIYFK